MAGEHEGLVAVVTGAASGIGRASAERLQAGGASVVAVDVAKDALDWAAGRDGILTQTVDVIEDLQHAGESLTDTYVRVVLSVETLETEMIQRALKENRGNVTRTAEALGLSRKGLQLKMKDYGIS